jgi:hypothetical protein
MLSRTPRAPQNKLHIISMPCFSSAISNKKSRNHSFTFCALHCQISHFVEKTIIEPSVVIDLHNISLGFSLSSAGD